MYCNEILLEKKQYRSGGQQTASKSAHLILPADALTKKSATGALQRFSTVLTQSMTRGPTTTDQRKFGTSARSFRVLFTDKS